MALVLADRVKETSTTFGLSDMVLLGAASGGYRAFNQVMTGGDTTYYCIVLQSANEWEVGIGTYQSGSNALTRNTVLSSSNNNNPVSFGVGTKDVFITYAASRSIYANGTTLQTTNSAILPVASGGSGASTAATARTNFGATTVGSNLFTLTNPSAITFLRVNADNSVSALDAATFRTAIGAGVGSVTSVAMTVPTGLSIAGSPITSSGTLALTFTAGYSIPTTSSQTNWDTAYTDRLKWDGGATGLTASTGRTSLGATTLGGNLFTITNPSAVTFPRFNADNTVSALNAADFRTAIGAGAGSVTSVAVSGGTTGLTTSGGPITSSGTITLAGTLAVANGGTGATSANAGLNNLQGYTTTATAAGTTTLTSTSSYKQYFTGTTTQTVVMPDVTTLALGRSYEIINNSTGTLTVQSSGLNAITTIPAGISGVVTCIAITGTTAASWHYEYASFDTITGTGASVLATSPTLVTPILGTPQSGNFSTGTFTWPTFNQNTTGTATNATNVTLTTSSTSSAFKIPFANTTASTTGNYGLLQDSAAEFTYNPSTNTLTVGVAASPKVYINRTTNVASGISWYSTSFTAWADYMASAGTTSCGPTGNITAPTGTLVTTWGLRSFIENNAGYGWTWESGTSTGQPTVVAEIRASDGAAKFGGTVTAPTFSGALSGTATNATNVTATTSTTASAFKVPFLNTTASTTGNYGLLQDSTATFTYNPSTNTLTADTFSGSLSGNATSASTSTQTSSLYFANPAAVVTATQTLPTLTTGMALVINGTGSPPTANFEPVVKSLTSSDSYVTITETSPGVWDLTAGAPPPPSGGWYTLQTTGTLATTIALPGSWTSSPTGTYGNVLMASSSMFGGSGWATGLSGPWWSSATYLGGWSTPYTAYYSNYANWSGVTNPATIWSSVPTSGGFVFNYMQYPPQSSNTFQADTFGSATSWNSGYGTLFSTSGPPTGSTRVFYVVLIISGNNTVTASGLLSGTTIETAYDSWSNYTYVFFKCNDNTSVGSIMSGASCFSWSSPNSYYGHGWLEYT